mgnify:CR=1 FL=1
MKRVKNKNHKSTEDLQMTSKKLRGFNTSFDSRFFNYESLVFCTICKSKVTFFQMYMTKRTTGYVGLCKNCKGDSEYCHCEYGKYCNICGNFSNDLNNEIYCQDKELDYLNLISCKDCYMKFKVLEKIMV